MIQMPTGNWFAFIPTNLYTRLLMVMQYLNSLKSDLTDEVRSALAAAVAKLNLVTRHEFDIQTKVLAATREKLEKLEQEISYLEHFKHSNPSSAPPCDS